MREQGCDEALSVAEVPESTSSQQPPSEGFQPGLWCQGLHKRLPVLLTHILEGETEAQGGLLGHQDGSQPAHICFFH